MAAVFSPELLKFLRQLEKNNDRDWFKGNQDRYEEHVREPTRAFIRAVAPQLAKISGHLVANDKKVGGSMMRPQRDIRFSKDKSPYKTNVGIQFRHADGKDVHAPGLYVHISPREGVFLACGMWRPDSPSLKAIRDRITAKPKAWLAARDDKPFRRHFELGGESLKRPPRGFEAEHPLVDDLKRTDHIAVCQLDTKMLTRPDFVKQVMTRFLTSKRYIKFLADAVGMKL